MDTQQATEQRKEREVSRYSYPYYDLDTAIEVARTLHDRAGGRATLAQFAKYMDHKDEFSGAFRSKLWGAKLFGLVQIEGSTSGSLVSVTRLGEELASSRIGIQRDRRLAQAFLSVPLFAEIYRRYQNTTLPSTRDGMKQSLQTTFGVPAAGVSIALKTFVASSDQAGFRRQDPNRLIHPVPVGLVEEPSPSPSPSPQIPEDVGSASAGETEVIPTARVERTGSVHPAIAGFLLALPSGDRKWSDGERQRWVDAFVSMVKALYPTQDEE